MSEHGLKIHKGKAHSTEKDVSKPEQLDKTKLKASDDTPTYTCPICKFKFTDQNVLEDHLHNNHKDIQTQYMKSHNNVIEIKDDTNPTHTSKTVAGNECKDCNLSFTTEETLNKHIATHRKLNIGGTTGVKFCCEFCDFKSVSIRQIRKHMMEKHNTGKSVLPNTPLLIPQEDIYDGSEEQIQSNNLLGKRNYKIMESIDCEVCGKRKY